MVSHAPFSTIIVEDNSIFYSFVSNSKDTLYSTMFYSIIKRPITLSMVTLVLIVLGTIAIRSIPISLLPDIDIPQITLHISSPDKSAREIDNTILSPLMFQLSQLDRLSDITATAKDGEGRIEMVFDYGTNTHLASIDVNERIDCAMPYLPQGTARPIVTRASVTDIPAFFINISLRNLHSPNPNRLMELSTLVKDLLARRIEQINEVAMVDISGTLYPEIVIKPLTECMNLYGINEELLCQLIQEANIQLGNITIQEGNYNYTLRFESTTTSKEDIENIYLRLNDRVLQIKDIAQVIERPQQSGGMIISDGDRGISIAVIKRSNARMSTLKHATERVLNSLSEEYPEIQFRITRNQTELLESSINSMIENILLGSLFACIVIFLFIGNIRTPILVVSTIPISLLITMLLFQLCSISINIISLSGLLLGVGMMVDSAIIVADNITQHLQRGRPAKEACVEGTREVVRPMLSSTLTTCAIFIPLIFISGIGGALFYDEAMAITLALTSSLIVTTTILPLLYYMLCRRKESLHRDFSYHQNHYITSLYHSLLGWCFRHQYFIWIIPILALPAITLLLSNMEKSKLPPITKQEILVDIDWRESIDENENLRRCNHLVEVVSGYLSHYTLQVGKQDYLLAHSGNQRPAESRLYLQGDSFSSIDSIQSHIATTLRECYPYAYHSFKASDNIFEMIFADKEPPIVLELRSNSGEVNLTEIDTIISQIGRKIGSATIEGPIGRESLTYSASPHTMALYNISYYQLYHALQRTTTNHIAMHLKDGNKTLPIRIETYTNRSHLNDNVYINNEYSIPLRYLVTEERKSEISEIVSNLRGEYIPIKIYPSRGNLPKQIESIQDIIQEYPKYQSRIGGSYLNSFNTIAEFIRILSLSILLLFLILAAQFESLIQPLIILSEVAIDVLSVLAIMAAIGESLNIITIIGIIVMCGIVINDSILKVDTINRQLRCGRSLLRAILTAGEQRLRPILMTSLTTILAISPLLLRGNMGSDIHYPLSLSLIIGLTVGTIVSLTYIPVIYYIIYHRRYVKEKKE